MNAEFARKKNVIVATADRTLAKSESGSLVTNVGAGGAVIVTLPADSEVNDTYLFVLGAAQLLTIANGKATEKFIINGGIQTADKDISADDEAEWVEITKVSATEWLCRSGGTWTVEG
jgi:hypothetical protein